MSNNNYHKYRVVICVCCWLFVAVLMVFIFAFSSQAAAKSRAVSMGVTEWLIRLAGTWQGLTQQDVGQLVTAFNPVIRKMAHFILYFLLGTGSWFAVWYTCGALHLRKGWNTWVVALGLSLLYAASDELHQLFVSGRGCELQDVLLDFAGAALGCLLAWTILCVLLGRKRGS